MRARPYVYILSIGRENPTPETLEEAQFKEHHSSIHPVVSLSLSLSEAKEDMRREMGVGGIK
jgi:hypothetical protein